MGIDGKMRLCEIEEALREFIIRSSKKEAPGYAVQTLPEAVEKYLMLLDKLKIWR